MTIPRTPATSRANRLVLSCPDRSLVDPTALTPCASSPPARHDDHPLSASDQDRRAAPRRAAHPHPHHAAAAAAARNRHARRLRHATSLLGREGHERASNTVNGAGSSSSKASSSAPASVARRIAGVHVQDAAFHAANNALRDGLEYHHDPLKSKSISEHDEHEKEPATPMATFSFSDDFARRELDFNPYWRDSPGLSPKPRSRSMALSGTATRTCREPAPVPASLTPMRTQPMISCTCESLLSKLRHEVFKLRAGNSALVTLKATHEQTITLLHDKIQEHESTIAKSKRQLQAKEAEQLCLLENFCAELSSRNRKIQSLEIDKWYLMGEIAQLEKTAGLDELTGCDETQETRDGPEPHVEERRVKDRNERSGDDYGTSQTSAPSSPSASVVNGPVSTRRNLGTPTTMQSSLPSPCPCSSDSTRGLHDATANPTIDKAAESQTPEYVNPKSNPWACRSSQSGASQPEVVSGEQTVYSEGRRAEHSRDSQFLAAHIMLAAKTNLEQSLHVTQAKLAIAEAHREEVPSQLAGQAAPFQHLSQTSAGPMSTPPALMPIPDLPVLTYTKPIAVWKDRVLTSFQYLGLLDFIERDVSRPDTSTWDATEVANWTSRRLRAVVLLKDAVDDEILEDVLFLHGRKKTASGPRESESDGLTPTLEDPRQLFTTITSLRRIIASSALDETWLDRVEDTDFDGIDSFTALVICIDKRHGLMYGTSADHYFAQVPKLQETMMRFFPDQKPSAFGADTAESPPRKRR